MLDGNVRSMPDFKLKLCGVNLKDKNWMLHIEGFSKPNTQITAICRMQYSTNH